MTPLWDLWDLSSGNRITATDDEAEIREILRVLLAAGEPAENLSVDGPGWASVREGAELAAWLEERNPVTESQCSDNS